MIIEDSAAAQPLLNDAFAQPSEALMMKSRIGIVALALMTAAGTSACGSSNADGAGGSAGTGGASGAGGAGGSDAGPDAGGQGIAQLPAGWNRIEPGGRTRCARGQPYEFYVRPGTVNKVVVEFEHGGACFDAVTCLGGFADHVRVPPEITDESAAAGLLDHADPRNPFRDWHHVYVPNCTGDLYWGDADNKYTVGNSTFTVMHRGAVNMQAVLDWMKVNVKDPSEIVAMGASSGAYGSIMWAPHLAREYPGAKVTQIADSGAGVYFGDLLPKVVPEWNVAASFKDIFPGVDPSKLTSIPDLYALVHSAYPDIQLSEYEPEFDENQTYWSGVTGLPDDPYAWSKGMRGNLYSIVTRVPDFRLYVAPGWRHNILARPQAYTMRSGGVAFIDWVNGLLARNAQSVDCGAHCGAPEIESGSSGWQCVGGASANPAPLQADLALPLQLLHYDPPDFGVSAGLSVRACASDDTTCSSPLDQVTTDAGGRVTLHVNSGSSGFAGYFSIQGTDVSSRLIIRPAIRDPQHPMIGDVYMWGIPTKTAMTHLAAKAGAVYDPSQGFVVVQALDCNLSARSDVTVELDGAAPTAFAGPLGWVPSQTPAIDHMWVNVAPGKHTVTVSLPGSTTPIASEDIDVDAGGITVLAGLSPQTLQPM